MPLPVIEFHPQAVAEAQAAGQWYYDHNPALRGAFITELDRAIACIVESPERWPKYEAGTRRFLLRRFPFTVVYRAAENEIQVVAVAHAKRKPGYWEAR